MFENLQKLATQSQSRFGRLMIVGLGAIALFSVLTFSSIAAPQTIAKLPNGNYRYTAATFSTPIVSDEELVEAGGYYFLFRKRGERVTGLFALVDSGETICMNGKVNGNTVTGQAVEVSEPPYNRKTILSGSKGENFVTWSKDGSLRVRRGSQRGNIIRYRSAILDLSGFHRINAGTQIPPRRCG